MRRTLASALVVLVVSVAPTLASGQAKPAPAVPKDVTASAELMQIENDWCTALMKNDAVALGKILADDASLVGVDGTLRTKAEATTRMKAAKVTACKNEMMKVRIYGDTAIVTGRNTETGVGSDKVAFTNDMSMWTDTFVKKDGRWQCVSTQSSPIKK